MRKIKSVLFLVLTLLLFGCNKSIYATDITVIGISDSYNVGDSISLQDVNIIINPLNVTVKPEVKVSDETIAMVTNSEIVFISAGECDIVFSVKSGLSEYVYHTKKVNIKNVTYANSLTFENNNVSLNVNDVLSNKLIINPSNCSCEPQITYSNNNVVSYNYLTGTITPINIGNTLVTATIKISKTETISASFNCTVTNDIFANNLTATILNSSNVTLKTGYSGNINVTVFPANYNMGITYSCSNNLITVLDDGNIVVGNNAGSGTISVKVKSESGEIVKNIEFLIVEPYENLDIDLLYNNQVTTKFYCGISYVACINNLNIDYSQVTFEGCNYTYLENNKFKIDFNNSGTIKFVAKYNYNLSSGVEVIKCENNLKVYNTISDFNFGLFSGENEIIPVNNEYNLSLIDLNNVTLAANNDVYNSATLIANPKGIDTNINDFKIDVVGDAVTFNNNIITANKVGIAKVNLSSTDPMEFSKSYLINVNEITVSNINLESNKISLNLGENNSCRLSYEVMPTYAFNKNVEIIKSNNIININGDVVTAVSYGECVITLKSGLITKEILVEVLPIPNKIIASINNETLVNNCIKTLTINSNVLVNIELYYNDIKVKNTADYTIYGDSVNISCDSSKEIFKITAIKLGESKVEFYYDDLLFTINFVVEDINTIIAAKFEVSSMDVNLFLTNTITPNILLTLKYPESQLQESNVKMVSTNNDFAVVNGDSVNLLKVGNVTINLLLNNLVVDSLELNVFYKEIVEINSVEQLKTLQNKSYLVTTNLDLSNFATIDNFDGEIDFNNHTITGLNVPLFNTLNSNAVIKNLNFKNDIVLNENSTSNYSVITTNNYGLIDNIKFTDLNISVNNIDANGAIFLSLICSENYGEICNIAFNNVTVNELRENITSSVSRFNGVAVNNNGCITGITGYLNVKNFVKFCGVCDTSFGDVSNVKLELNLVTPSKFVGAGLIYTVQSENIINISDIDLTINLSGNSNINTFGCVFKSINCNCNLENINVEANLSENYSNEKLALFSYNVATDFNIVLTNCNYKNIDGFSAVINGELNF